MAQVPTYAQYKRKGGQKTERAWNTLTDEAKQSAYDEASTSTSTSTSNTTSNTTSTMILDTEALKVQQTIKTLMDSNIDAQTRQNTLTQLAVDMINKEGDIRKRIVQDLGQTGELQSRNVKIIAQAGVEAALYGVSMEKLLETVSTLSKTMGTNIAFDDNDIERIAIFSEAMNVGLYDVTKMVKQFEMMGIGIDGAIDKGNEMAEVARNMGVNMDGFMGIIADNLDMMNTYNFADGVKGFAKMAAQAQRLGLSMSTTAALAEKVMDPEGAIELAANLQVIGGAVGDLADPFKLMYMATNDVAGLQDALVNVGKDLVVFNKETGEMSIPPTAQRQMRAYAETLNMSTAEFAEMVKMQGKFEAVTNQLNLSDFSKEMEESGVGEYIASIAQMGKGGRYQVQVDGEMKNVDMLSPDDMKQLQEDARLDADKKALTEKDIMLEQTTVLQSMNRSLHAIAAKGFDIGLDVLDPAGAQEAIGKKLTRGLGKQAGADLPGIDKDGLIHEMGSGLKDMIFMGMNGVFMGNNSTTNPINWESIGETIFDGFELGFEGIFGKGGDGQGGVIDKISNMMNERFGQEVETENRNDFMLGQGQAKAVITSKGMIIPSPNDTVMGVDLTAGATTPNMGALNTSMPTNQSITLNTNKIQGEVKLTIDGKNLGKMSGREIVDAILSNQTNKVILTDAIASTNTITAQDGRQYEKDPLIA